MIVNNRLENKQSFLDCLETKLPLPLATKSGL